MVPVDLIFMHPPYLMWEKEWLLKNKESKIDRMEKNPKRRKTGTITGFFYTGHATRRFYSTDKTIISIESALYIA